MIVIRRRTYLIWLGSDGIVLNENRVGTRAEREERSLLVVLTWVFSSVQVGLAGGGLAMHSAGEGS